MNSIADSDAVFDKNRMLAQHQAAVTLLQSQLGNPGIIEFVWLDLACGRGQIVTHLQDNLSRDERAKLRYVGQDIDNGHVRIAEAAASVLGLREVSFYIGEVSRFSELITTGQSFDFITLTNTIHEVHPVSLSQLLCDCILRLSPEGCLFIYDMETLPHLELGAIVWNAQEMKTILGTICNELGAVGYAPSVGKWRHSSCCGWNAQIRRQHLGSLELTAATIANTVRNCSLSIRTLMETKKANIEIALENLTRFGAQTDDEKVTKQRLLYDFWALSRALKTR